MKKKKMLLLIMLITLSTILTGCGLFSSNVDETIDTAKRITFENEVLTMINASQNMFIETSLSTDLSNEYLKSSDNNDYKAMCFTLEALVQNGYLDKDITNYGGIFLAESKEGRNSDYITAWAYNNSYGINGVEKNNIYNLNDDDFKLLNDTKNLIDQAKNNNTITITSPSNQGGTGATYTNIKCIKDRLY